MLRIAKYLLPLVLFPATCLAWTPLPTSIKDPMAADQNFLEVYRKMNALQYEIDSSTSAGINISSGTQPIATNYVTGSAWGYTGVSGTITPRNLDSTILVFPNVTYRDGSSANTESCEYRIQRGNTPLGIGTGADWRIGVGGSSLWQYPQQSIADTPLTTSATSYYLYARETSGAGSCGVDVDKDARIVLVEILKSGATGPKGDAGSTGATGATGAAGADATISIGSVVSVSSLTSPSVTNVGTSGAAIFDFELQQGIDGIQGPVGPTGEISAATFNAHTVATSTHGATENNTASRIVLRDGAGSFAMSSLTASSVTAQDIRLTNAELNNGPFTVSNFLDNSQSAGRFTPLAVNQLTDNGDGTVAVAAGTGLCNIAETSVGDIRYVSWTAKPVQTLADNAQNWVYGQCGASGVTITTTTDRTTISTNTAIILGRAYRQGTDADITPSGLSLDNYFRRNHERLIARGTERMSGFVLAETGTRYLTMTAGVLYVGNTRINTSAVDTSGAGTYNSYHRDGAGGWTKVSGQKVIPNDGYDNNSGSTVSLTSNRYSVFWMYSCPEGTIYLLFGQGDYTLANADLAQPPATIPPYLQANGLIIGKIIVKKGAMNLSSFVLAFTTMFVPVSVAPHNDLAGLNDGDNYEHYTASQQETIRIATTTPSGGGLSAVNLATVTVPSTFGTVVATGTVGFDNRYFEVSTNAVVSLSTGIVVLQAGGSVNATGGTITYDGAYTVHTFTSTSTFTPSGNGTIQVMLIAGGGGGGGGLYAGGGGAGGMLEKATHTVIAETSYSVIVGTGGIGGASGGASGSQGGNSFFDGMLALGGGGGAYYNATGGTTGGSGGGMAANGGTGLAATQVNSGGAIGYGFKGGDGDGSWGGSGGCAGGAGVNTGGTLCAGRSNSISGSAIAYGVGGGGSAASALGTAGTDARGNGGYGGGWFWR